MGSAKLPRTDAWAITDVYGEIRSLSRAAQLLLGLAPVPRGRHNLLQLFPEAGKALVLDIEMALTGWPTERTLALRRPGARTIAVRYRLSRRLDSEALELFWHLECAGPEELWHAA